MASMREMAKKNLEKMVKGAAREVNTSRPARDGRSGASATPPPAKKPAAEAPAKSTAPAKADAVAEAAATPATAKTDAAKEAASSSGQVDSASSAAVSSADGSEAVNSAKAGASGATKAGDADNASGRTGTSKTAASAKAGATSGTEASSAKGDAAEAAHSAKAGAAAASSAKDPTLQSSDSAKAGASGITDSAKTGASGSADSAKAAASGISDSANAGASGITDSAKAAASDTAMLSKAEASESGEFAETEAILGTAASSAKSSTLATADSARADTSEKTMSAKAGSLSGAAASAAQARTSASATGANSSTATSSENSSGAADVNTDVNGPTATATTPSAKTNFAAEIAAAAAKTPAVPASVFEQLQAQILKNGKTIQKVPVDSIKLNENIREAYNDEHLKTLADSMQKDGLIQFPTLCLKSGANGEFTFVCKNGHRRILAAKSLGWKTIECVILPFASTRDELYHTIAANLREDVFYLDLALAYQQANHLGESDQAIAERVGVNPRTVGWYRRLTTMAPECQTLCRQYPDLFHATWAIQLARKGELPPLAVLMKQMQFMLMRYQALKNSADQAPQPDRLPKTIDVEQQREAKSSLKSLFSGARGSTEAQQAWQLVEQLCIAGYFKPALLNRMRRQLLSGAQKSSRRASATES